MTAVSTVLVVDDNPTNLGVLSNVLDHAGFRVLIARDGESALQKVQRAAVDLILLDVMMPGIDGFETCRRLKENAQTNSIPVIFMTALSETIDKVKGLNLGAVDYITKPFEAGEVLARIGVHLKIHELTRSLTAQNQQLQQENANRLAAEQALQQLTQELEQRVQERTAALSGALHNLQQAQVQLVQQEKLSALGQLVAGIAHEINNPVNFIHGNLNHAQSYVKDLLETLNQYQQLYPHPVEELKQHCESIDLDFLVEDLPKLVGSMQLGTRRILEIVLGLRNFSRLDEAEKKPVDLHEGLESTLLLLRHRLKAPSEHFSIEIIRDYGELPLVQCYAGQLNQVFMNLLVNAIDAIEHKPESTHPSSDDVSAPGKITITTQIKEQQSVLVRIADNGTGMTETVQNKLFEPFFTTKAVGKGTGLGLSISRQIIEEQHNGKLICISEVGKGTEFIIEIPLAVN